MLRSTFGFCLIVTALSAAETSPDPLLNWLDRLAQQQLDKRQARLESVRSVADANKRRAEVKAKILEIMGGLPDYHGPLNPRVTGSIPMSGYVIEKLTFESLPSVFVTANLYRPSQPGRYPGILLPLGHWDYGKPAVQRIAGNLALKGFVVLTYDPFGQGERQQLYDRRLEGSLANQGTEQHLLAGGLNLLIGLSFARNRIWDAKRALDYLVSRPEVLADKIGCTGCSGGGTITTYISALDDRILVAAPACYINSFRELFKGPVGDSEQSLPGFLAAGLDIPDYVELFAPKPWLISSTQNDFFPLAGAKIAYEEARKWYSLWDASEKLQWVVGPGGHGTPLKVREAIYDWMIRWLREGQGSAQEQEVVLLPEDRLYATPTGQVADLPGSREVFDVLRNEWRRGTRPGSEQELRTMLTALIDPPHQPPAGRINSGNVIFEAEPGLDLHAVLMAHSTLGPRAAVLLIDDRAQAAPRAQELFAKGNVVLILSPRGTPIQSNSRAYSGDWLSNVRAMLIGKNLPALRAHDILSGYQILRGMPGVDPARISAEASGMAGVWLLMAAAVEPELRSIQITRTPYSFASAFLNPLTRDLHSAIIPGFSLHWDLTDLSQREGITVVDPVDWLGKVVVLPGKYTYKPADQ